ncbi:MAG: acyltransferase family protein [Ilumatobacteraceae bacterium]
MSRPGLGHQPALDGVRALAVTLVVLFHLGVGWMPGGYLGVSVFFTLSGFLITSLLLGEADHDGRVDFARFYGRRARRLLPASLAVLLAVVVARGLGEFELVPGLRADLLGALLQVFNWVQIAGSSSYTALFGQSALFTSPLEHYWSLAIEEQFYLLWPVCLVGLWRWSTRRGRDVLGPVLALTALFAVLAPLIGVWFGPDTAYWSTPSRLPELLVGAALAAWWRRGPQLHPRMAWLAPVAAVAIVVCSATFPSGAGPAFTGWLAPFALVSAALVLGLQFDGPVRTALSVRPVVWLGKVSYGLYLVHWPVFVLLRQHGWDTRSWGGALLAVGITLAITAMSYRLLEQPVRNATWVPRRTARTMGLASALVLAAVLVVVPVGGGFLEANGQLLEQASIDTGAPAETLARATTTTAPEATVPSSRPSPTTSSTEQATTTTAGEVVLPLPPTPSRPVRILMVGDSTAFYAGQGLAAWAVANPQYAQTDLLWCQGCGFILDGEITSFNAAPFVENSRRIVQQDLPERIRRVHPDVVVLMTTIVDIADRQWSPDEGVLTPLDARYRERMTTQYAEVTRSLLDLGVSTVVWVLPPPPHSYFETADLGESSRYEVEHQVIRETVAGAAAAPGQVVRLADMAGWFAAAGHSEDEMWRPDGTHMTEQSATWLAERWFGPWLIGAALGG